MSIEDREFDRDVNKIEKLVQEALNKVNWKKHGIKMTGTLRRADGVRFLTEDHDLQMFVEISGSPR